ncbi:MAG TPA: DEAD/DEAH box helicase family protein, partial [Gammaproteobacteria bacterium]|nr:DEAD/DEAH box helicase family protein [Gammaproteobacteria bacterium]
MELRQYQNKAIQELRLMFKSGFTRIMLHLPVGSGKTEIASEMIKRAVERGNRSLFICERISLVEQAAIRFASNGLHVGITQGDHPGYDPG